jgi:hypothetical protein
MWDGLGFCEAAPVCGVLSFCATDDRLILRVRLADQLSDLISCKSSKG